jgi:hypothetical protein
MQPGHPIAQTVRRLGAGGHERQHPRAATSVRQEMAYAGCALRGCEREAIRRASELTFRPGVSDLISFVPRIGFTADSGGVKLALMKREDTLAPGNRWPILPNGEMDRPI